MQLAYNGSAYYGWQIQPEAITVQETIEKALSTILKTELQIVGAGRTDTGVHASQMFAHFDVKNPIIPIDLKYRLNSFLPKDIAIESIFEVAHDAHTRFDATKRTYNYNIALVKNVFKNDYSYYVSQELDIEKMNNASKILLDYTNFQCFSKSNTDVKTYNCTIEEAHWQLQGDMLVFTISADRFLRNMVRAIVGTLISIGLGKLTVEDMHLIIASRDRRKAGFSVPAKGLFLTKVQYPRTIKLKEN